jgi:hypothetical protein
MEKLPHYHFSWKFSFQKQRQCETLALDTKNVKWYIWIKSFILLKLRTVSKKLYNTNQRHARLYKLIFNFCFLLHVSNLVGSSSTRTHTPIHLSTRLLTPMHVKYTILHIQLPPWGWTHAVRNVGENRNSVLIDKIVYFIGLCCIII